MKIDSQTSLYAVFGNPVGHSLSPVMHNRAFAAAGHNGAYLAFQVSDIAAGMAAVRAIGIRGVSVTIPHKVAVMNWLDEIDDQARRIGAVNTVVNRSGRLCGYNSDGEGAVKALLQETALTGAQVAVLGAGGAARAIGFGMVDHGARVTIINRSIRRGEALARDLSADFQPLSEIKKIDAGILINATPVGMTPQRDAMALAKGLLRRDMLVMDIVYNPVKTVLLNAAEAIGCRTIDGVAMFVYQGAFQFRLWTEQAAPLETMRAAVIDGLNADAGGTGRVV